MHVELEECDGNPYHSVLSNREFDEQIYYNFGDNSKGLNCNGGKQGRGAPLSYLPFEFENPFCDRKTNDLYGYFEDEVVPSPSTDDEPLSHEEIDILESPKFSSKLGEELSSCYRPSHTLELPAPSSTLQPAPKTLCSDPTPCGPLTGHKRTSSSLSLPPINEFEEIEPESRKKRKTSFDSPSHDLNGRCSTLKISDMVNTDQTPLGPVPLDPPAPELLPLTQIATPLDSSPDDRTTTEPETPNLEPATVLKTSEGLSNPNMLNNPLQFLLQQQFYPQNIQQLQNRPPISSLNPVPTSQEVLQQQINFLYQQNLQLQTQLQLQQARAQVNSTGGVVAPSSPGSLPPDVYSQLVLSQLLYQQTLAQGGLLYNIPPLLNLSFPPVLPGMPLPGPAPVPSAHQNPPPTGPPQAQPPLPAPLTFNNITMPPAQPSLYSSDEKITFDSPKMKAKDGPEAPRRSQRTVRPKVIPEKGAIQCAGTNRKKNKQCRNAALMEYIGPRPVYCAEHIHLDPNCLYAKCKSTYQKVPGDRKGCREVVLKEFTLCHKHYPEILKKLAGEAGAAFVVEKLKRATDLLANLEDEAMRAKKTDTDLFQRKNKLIPKFMEMKTILKKKLLEFKKMGFSGGATEELLGDLESLPLEAAKVGEGCARAVVNSAMSMNQGILVNPQKTSNGQSVPFLFDALSKPIANLKASASVPVQLNANAAVNVPYLNSQNNLQFSQMQSYLHFPPSSLNSAQLSHPPAPQSVSVHGFANSGVVSLNQPEEYQSSYLSLNQTFNIPTSYPVLPPLPVMDSPSAGVPGLH